MFTWLKLSAGSRYARHLRGSPPIECGERPRHLLIDVSVLRRSDARTGIQRVVRAVIAHLSTMDLGDMVVKPVFATRREPYSYCDMPLPLGITEYLDKGVVSPCEGDVFLGLDLAAHLLPIHERQVADWKSKGVMIALVVYDLLPLRNAQWFTTKLRRAFGRWFDILARRADCAICISQSVADELADKLTARRMGRLPPKIYTVKLGSDIQSTLPDNGLPPEAHALLARVSACRTILMVGTVEPRKAYDMALAAFERLWQKEGEEVPTLLIVGRPGWKSDNLQRKIEEHPQNGRKLIWLNDVSDEFLDKLYDAAAGVLMTSHAEGCGLPVLEALAHRRPVLARDLPVFREIDQTGIVFFGDDDPDALAESVTAFLNNLPRSPGPLDGEHLLWADTAASLLKIVAYGRISA